MSNGRGLVVYATAFLTTRQRCDVPGVLGARELSTDFNQWVDVDHSAA